MKKERKRKQEQRKEILNGEKWKRKKEGSNKGKKKEGTT